MTVDELKQFIEAISNRNQSGNALTPDEFNIYLARANEDKFRIETGIRESQTPIWFQSNQISTDALRPFIIRAILFGTSGLFTIPNDYRHLISMYYKDPSGRQRIITPLNVDEFDAIIDHPVKAPSNEYPYASQYGSGIEVRPSSITAIGFAYLRKPAIPVWGYTIDPNTDEPIYNSATSVQMEWEDIYQIDIARIILSYLSINFRDSELYQMAEASKKQGA